MFTKKKRQLFYFGWILSSIIGVLLSGFYYLQAILIEFFWPDIHARPIINALIVLIIGGLIIWATKKFGTLPQNIGVIKSDLKHHKTANYRYVWLQLVIPAFILVSGTSLGPEATLVSSTVLFGTWLRDKLRYYDQNYVFLNKLSRRNRYLKLFHPTKHILKKQVEGMHKTVISKKSQKWLRNFYFANGVGWFALVYWISGQPSLIIRIGESHWQPKAWFIMIPLLILSYSFGIVLNKLLDLLKQIIFARFQSTTTLVVFGGLAIYFASLMGPEMLFSGQHNFHLFITDWPTKATTYLIFIALGKFILLTICKSTGWLGGDIFPILFASTVLGFVVASFLPSLDQIFVVVIISMGMSTAMLKSPILVGSLMPILFAPVYLLPIVITATALMYFYRHRTITKFIKKIRSTNLVNVSGEHFSET